MEETSANRKIMKNSELSDLDEAISIWFRNARGNNIAIPVVHEKFQDLAQNLDFTNVKPSCRSRKLKIDLQCDLLKSAW